MFAFNQTTSYALLALNCLARGEASWRFVGDVSRCIGVPSPYLSKVLHGLARSGLVETKRGYKGGYRLARSANSISLLEVVRAVDDRYDSGRCMLGLAECSDNRACPLHGLWKAARSRIIARLASITLTRFTRSVDFCRMRCKPSSAPASTRGVVRARPKLKSSKAKPITRAR